MGRAGKPVFTALNDRGAFRSQRRRTESPARRRRSRRKRAASYFFNAVRKGFLVTRLVASRLMTTRVSVIGRRALRARLMNPRPRFVKRSLTVLALPPLSVIV